MSAAFRPTQRVRRSADGFTLVELLVATTVTLVLVVVLVRVFNGASGTWRHGEAQVDAYREARGALQLMAHDLSATLAASYAQAGGGADLANANPTMPTLAFRRYSGTSTPAGQPVNEEVYCLTNISNHGSSSLCTVGYFCQWMADDDMFPSGTPDQRPRAFALMRQSLDSNGTFKRISHYAANAPLDFLMLYQRNLTSGPMSNDPPVAVATPVASYVWDVRFRIDTDLDDVAMRDASDPLSSAATDHSSPANPTRYYYGTPGQNIPPRLPPYVEVRFKALSSLAARRLEGTSAGVTQTTWGSTTNSLYQQIIQPNYQQFVLRVPLLNGTQPAP